MYCHIVLPRRPNGTGYLMATLRSLTTSMIEEEKSTVTIIVLLSGKDYKERMGKEIALAYKKEMENGQIYSAHNLYANKLNCKFAVFRNINKSCKIIKSLNCRPFSSLFRSDMPHRQHLLQPHQR